MRLTRKSRILLILSLSMGMHPYSGIKNHIAGSACMRSRRFLPYTLQTDVHVSYVDFSFWKPQTPPPPPQNDRSMPLNVTCTPPGPQKHM